MTMYNTFGIQGERRVDVVANAGENIYTAFEMHME
jgi:hypothetical protein